MALIPCSDLTAARWLTAAHSDHLIDLGPPGFARYARLRFLPDPTHEGQRENDVVLGDDALPESTQIHAALGVLQRWTSTPDDCYFCLWDGWGWEVRGEERRWELHRTSVSADPDDYPCAAGTSTPGWAARPAALPAVPEELAAEVPAPARAPKVVVPLREYYLFRGAISDFGDWGLPLTGTGRGVTLPEPAFIWPADKSWCVTNDVDPHWAAIAADAAVIDELLMHPLLDLVAAGPGADLPYYR